MPSFIGPKHPLVLCYYWAKTSHQSFLLQYEITGEPWGLWIGDRDVAQAIT
jgi:hypothetical protein